MHPDPTTGTARGERIAPRPPKDPDCRPGRLPNRRPVQDRPNGLAGLLLLDPVAAVEAVVSPFIKNGPLRPVVRRAIAAAQVHQTGHSSIAQHFRRMKVVCADNGRIVLRAPLEDAPQGGTQGRAWARALPALSNFASLDF